MNHPDFLVIGGGILGILISTEARRRYPDAHVLVLEKEDTCGLHASGRNSGVLHAGFYYTGNSLKARFSVLGNTEMKAYCREKGLPLNECGKLVIAKNEDELGSLDSLLRRGEANGVVLQSLSEEEARRIEPRVKTYGRAIFSPTTATVDPRLIMKTLVADATEIGVDIRAGTAYRVWKDGIVYTDQGRLCPGYVINTAGIYADRVARDFGFSQQYRLLPFKGLYLHSDEPANSFRTNIYPVPDLDKPFLGIHFTITVDGKAKIGPTAMPAFWCEHYRGLSRFSLTEMCEILWREALLFLSNKFGFRDLALQEVSKYHRPTLVGMASKLATGVNVADYRRWGKPGIRAQLLDLESQELVMDFVYEGSDRSFHVLNVVSPGFTCAFPFSRHLFDKVDDLIR